MTTPRGIRNRNPGNIVQSSIPWKGKIAKPDDPRFEQFESDFYGIRALASLLLTYQDKHGLRTVRGAINRWAPPIENNTSAYVTAVAKELGVSPDETLDFHRFTVLAPFATAIIRHENGQQPYSAELIASAVNDALGVEATRPAGTPAPQLPAPGAGAQPIQREGQLMSSNVIKTAASIASIFNPLAGGIIGLAGNLFQAVQPELQSTLAKAVNKHTADPSTGEKVAETLANFAVAQAQALTGEADQFKAVASITTDPAQAENFAKLQANVDSKANTFLLEAGDKSIEWDERLWSAQIKGRKASSSVAIEEHKAGIWDMTRTVVCSLLAMLWGIAWGLGWGILKVIEQPEPNTMVLVALIGLSGPIWTGAIVASVAAIVAYRFDGTKASSEQSKAVLPQSAA